MTKTITVTQKDIDDGEQDSTYSCPIALAANRTLNRHDVFVSGGYMAFGNKKGCLPIKAQKFICHFDSDIRVKPFSFKIQVSCRVNCHFCNNEDVWPGNPSQPLFVHPSLADAPITKQAAHYFRAKGWVVVTSRKYIVTGAVRCPDCNGEI
jgi:hypothetical protein